MTTARPQPNTIRERLVIDFSQWVASCAVNPDIYRALDGVDFDSLFSARAERISANEFDRWHQAAVAELCSILPGLGVGWAAKAINECLKTRCYLGGYGRDGLSEVIHPPIDDGLTRGLKREFARVPDIRRDLDQVPEMRDMNAYADYERLIGICKRVARISGCSLLESEQFWE